MPIAVWRSMAACTLVLAAFATSLRGEDLQPKIDPLARPLVEQEQVVGLVIGIVQDGNVQIIAYGETAKGSGKAPDGKTVYEIGSATKAFTGILLADAIESGLVKLDDPAQKFLPRNVRMPIADGGPPITLEHLATHTSGLPRLPENFAPGDVANPYADYSVQHLYEFLNNHKSRRPPGEYEYSNLGMGLLGHVLARQQHTSYERLLAKRITGPLDMHDTSITLSEGQRTRLAPPYDAALEPAKNWDLPTLAGAGAIRSTADDMLKFLKANLANDERPLSKALRRARIQRHSMPDGLAIGLGWHLARDGVTWWHNGMTGGYASWMAVVPQAKAAVVVLANTATMKITELGEQVTRVACGLTVQPPDAQKEVEVDPKVLESYVGAYEIVPQFVLTVTLENGKLMAQATGQSKFPVFAASPTDFFYKVVDAQISFVADKDGKVTHLVLHQNGQHMKGARRD